MHVNADRPEDAGRAPAETVNELVQLRSSVEEWAKQASGAVLRFQRPDGSFWKDTTAIQNGEGSGSPHITTTARAFIGLLYADRLEPRKFAAPKPVWYETFREFVGKAHITCEADGGFSETRLAHTAKAPAPDSKGFRDDLPDVNVFDAAHLADYLQVADYLNRFYPNASPSWTAETLFSQQNVDGEKSEGPAILAPAEHIKKYLLNAIEKVDDSGEAYFETPEAGAVEKPEARHFFATLHALRGLHVLGGEVPEITLKRIVDAARAFSIEQAFYHQRGVTHRQDPVRLAFAGCIYTLYSDHVDRDVCSAIIEALAAAQQQNGSWPATHPIIRGQRLPWHIASHEVALCLTWLYFQPKFPDEARGLLITMMSRYFRQAVIPTFVRTPLIKCPGETEGREYMGWQDDHTRSDNTAVGWATAIVCHFLGNFSVVLSDWINRQIADELGLTQACGHLLIDSEEAEGRRSLQWVKPENHDALWPDLPPTSWSPDRPDAEGLADRLSNAWTDPTDASGICQSVAKNVLVPILEAANGRPRWDRCTGILPGAPGTRKTSLIKQLAEVLRWPMIPVPASLIFERGFDMMEAQASLVFGRLNHIRGCILFFDEFEEFFASRVGPSSNVQPVDAGPEADSAVREEVGRYQSRTIAAFTTSAMLPRLQDLHDQTQCLIFVATNHIEKIDPAIIRRGRFDFRVTVNNPTARRLAEYVRSMPPSAAKRVGLDKLQDEPRQQLMSAVAAALDTVEEGADRPMRFELIETVLRTVRPREDTNVDTLTAEVKGLLEARPQANVGAPELSSL